MTDFPVPDDIIEEMFGEEARRYPGSKKTIPERVPEAAATQAAKGPSFDAAIDRQTWGTPVMKRAKGKPIELWTMGAIARAMGRSFDTMRQWEKNGRLPPAPFRFRVAKGPRGEPCYRRYYSERSIRAAIDCAEEAGFYETSRIDWSSERAQEFTTRLTGLWAAETSEYV